MRPTIVIQEKNSSQILSATVNTELQIISPAIQSYNRPPSLLTGSRWQEKCFFFVGANAQRNSQSTRTVLSQS